MTGASLVVRGTSLVVRGASLVDVVKKYEKMHAWVLTDAKLYKKPESYSHLKGAVIFFDLVKAMRKHNAELEAMRKHNAKAMQCASAPAVERC